MRYHTAIVGSGPAGLEAAVNLKVRNKPIILFGNKNLSTKLSAAPVINNYLGFHHVTGEELKNRFTEHIEAMNIVITEAKITNIYNMGGYFSLAGNKGDYEASTIILATGVQSEKMLKGEAEFLGKGVGYCATCDAPLFRGKRTAIVGYNEEAAHEANFIAEFAEKVYYVSKTQVNIKLRDNIEIINDVPLEIKGNNFVSKLVLKNSELPLDGVFILRNSVPPSYLVPELELEGGFIKVDSHMRTSVKGMFAAGDCTGKPHQYMRAAGQGQIAGLSAVEYLDKTLRT